MAKRGNNEGTIIQLPDDRWCAFAHLGYRNGKRWRKKITGKTRREVQDKLTQVLETVRKGEPVNTDRLSVKDYLRTWLNEVAKASTRPSTFSSYSDQIERYLIPRIGALELSKLNPQHVRRCLNDLLRSGGIDRTITNEDGTHPVRPLSPRTVQYCRAILRKALNQAIKDGLISRNVAALTDPPKTRAHEIEPYTPAQARKFLQALKGDRLEALFTVAVSLGLRQGEIIGLRWEDVDLKNRKIHVRCQLQRVDGKPTFLPLKTKKSRRILTVPALAIPILYAHQLRQQEEQSLAGDRWREYGLVFTTKLAHL